MVVRVLPLPKGVRVFSKIQCLGRTLALGLVLAVAAFCYATGNSSSGDPRSTEGLPEDAGNRRVGSTNLRFTNVLLPNGTYDLGDACYGSAVNRYITMAGGVRPYSFSSPNLLNVLLAGNNVTNASLTIGASGEMLGTIAPNVIPPPIVFTVSGKDSTGSMVQTVSGTFILNVMLCGAGQFHFAVDNVNNGQVGLNYISCVETMGGVGTVNVTVVPNTLTVNGVTRGTTGGLETIGLSMSRDGTIYGKPLEAGLVSFKAHAVDSLNRVAKDRTNTVPDQVVSFNIEPNQIASVDLTSTQISVKGDTGKNNKDTVKFKGFINLNGNAISSLRFTIFTFRLGPVSFSGQFDVHGNVVNRQNKKIINADGSTLKARADAHAGTISGTISKATVVNLLNNAYAITDHGTAIIAAGMALSNNVVAADTVKFATQKKGTKIQLNYQLGRFGTPMAGGFQLLAVQGKDGKTPTGSIGDAWKAKFMIVPRFGIDTNAGLDSLSAITVRINTNFVQPITGLNSSKSGNITISGKHAIKQGVDKLTINGKNFTGSLQTFPLPTIQTFISPASQVTAPNAPGTPGPIPPGSFVSSNFDLGLDLTRTGNNASFTGEYGKFILGVPNQKAWLDSIGKASRGAQFILPISTTQPLPPIPPAH
jgi:hypothetical protein